MMLMVPLVLLLFSSATAKAMPVNTTGDIDAKIPMLPPMQQKPTLVNPQDITLFTTMFLNLLKGTGDWRNQVAVETVESVWQSPPIVDFSHRLFPT